MGAVQPLVAGALEVVDLVVDDRRALRLRLLVVQQPVPLRQRSLQVTGAAPAGAEMARRTAGPLDYLMSNTWIEEKKHNVGENIRDKIISFEIL